MFESLTLSQYQGITWYFDGAHTLESMQVHLNIYLLIPYKLAFFNFILLLLGMH